MRIGDLVTFNKKMWDTNFDAYLCKNVTFLPEKDNDFRNEYLGIDSMMVVYIHPFGSVGDKYALLSPSGRIGWVWDVWVKSVDV